MEDKTFDKEKASAAGHNGPAAGHNKRRRRRKKGGAQQPAQKTARQPDPAGEDDSRKAAVSPEPEAAAKPEEKEQPEPSAKTESTVTAAGEAVEKQTPEAPEKPEPPEDKPEKPQSPEMPEPAQKSEPAADPDKTAEETQPAPEAEKNAADPDAAPETPEDRTEEDDTAEGEEADPEQERRAAEMTRTVQISIEKIVETIEAEESEPEPEESEHQTDPADAVPLGRLQRLHQQVGDSLWSLLKWVAFVVAFVAVVAGAGIAWLYKGATADSIPQVSAVFNGQELEASSYSWHVPVVANVFKRTYARTNSRDPVEIEQPVQAAQVDLDVKHPDCDTKLTVEDSAGETVFEGTAEQFGNFTFTDNDTYTAELVIFRTEKKISHTAEVSGKQTYLFSFTVSLRPSIRLNTVSASQGGVAAVRVSGGAADQAAPTLTTELTATAFHRGENDWVCYLPIPVNQEPGDYTVSVSYGGYTQELTLTVKARANTFKDYSRKSQLTSPYIGETETPAEVQALLQTGEETAAWSEDGFVIPFASKAEVELAYGTTEYVGRTRSERVAGTGTGRVSTNVVVSTTRGGDLVAPAAGKVVLAKDLGGTAGYTLVIDHGAGVKSIFYCLRSISVQVGTTVKAGQTLAETDRTTIGEVRVGTVPVEPISVWRGECDALSHY